MRLVAEGGGSCEESKTKFVSQFYFKNLLMWGGLGSSSRPTTSAQHEKMLRGASGLSGAARSTSVLRVRKDPNADEDDEGALTPSRARSPDRM